MWAALTPLRTCIGASRRSIPLMSSPPIVTASAIAPSIAARHPRHQRRRRRRRKAKERGRGRRREERERPANLAAWLVRSPVNISFRSGLAPRRAS
eukprot:3249647-Rhodomonas_salina.3